MRLHRLRIQAFGPFPDAVEVDLDALGADGLFLIHGDTGAGKTSLLDAVSFALFGRVPGPRGEVKRLRCDRAHPHLRTEVRVEATLGGHRVEIVRSPEYPRAKTRGTGTTLVRSKVLLRWLGPAAPGTDLTGLTRADEVGQAVADLLGMSADQFFQVVLLPQGEFARFLRADTADRAAVLARLFDTERFGAVEEWFATARRGAADRLRQADTLVAQRIARVAEAAQVDSPEQVDERWLADLRDRHADIAEVLDGTAARRRSARDAARAEADAARHRADRVRALRELLARQADLDRAVPGLDRLRRLVDRHAQAQPIAALATQHATAADGHRAASAGWRSAAAALRALASADPSRPAAARSAAGPVATFDPDDGLGVVDGLRGERADSAGNADGAATMARVLRENAAEDRDLAGGLAAALDLADEQQRDGHALDAARARHHRVEVDRVDVEQQLALLPTAIDDLAERLEAARSARDRLPAAVSELQAARLAATAAAAVPGLTRQLARLTDAATAAVDAHQGSVDRRQRLTERRMAGMAAELAGGLLPGARCPVCGSADHPQPAAAGENTVRADDLDAARRAEESAAADRERAAVRRTAAEAELAAAVAVAGGLTARRSGTAERRAEQAVARLTAVAAARDELLGRHDAAGKRYFELSLRREDLAVQLAAAAAQVRALSDAVAARSDRLQRACAGHPTVAARRSFLLRQAAAAEDLAGATDLVAASVARLSGVERALRAALDAAGFADLPDAMSAAELDRNRCEDELREAADSRAALRSRLADPGFTGLDPAEQVPVVASERAAQRATSAADDAIAAAHSARQRQRRVAAATMDLRRAWTERVPAAAAEAELAALTDVLHGRGQNALGISLRTYVLAARLGQVAAAAGTRLERMSAARYTFVPSADRESRGRAGGLGLDVLDAWSGLGRPTKTLSGGESFLASLALALGLADVVAAESGGRLLDTLFVDEGFGSLDPEALDMVMDTLDDLRAGGRVVGVVSHVEELRQRIPTQVRVRRTRSGSSVELITGVG